MDGIEVEMFQIMERTIRHQLILTTYPDRSYSCEAKTVDGFKKAHGRTIRDAVQEFRRQANV